MSVDMRIHCRIEIMVRTATKYQASVVMHNSYLQLRINITLRIHHISFCSIHSTIDIHFDLTSVNLTLQHGIRPRPLLDLHSSSDLACDITSGG